MTKTDRETEVTEMVSLWITNDSDWYNAARFNATTEQRLPRFLREVLRNSPRNSAAWHVAQELSPNDYNRVDWAQVARDLIGE